MKYLRTEYHIEPIAFAGIIKFQVMEVMIEQTFFLKQEKKTKHKFLDFFNTREEARDFVTDRKKAKEESYQKEWELRNKLLQEWPEVIR